jgi:hypothetical protein
VYCPRKLLQFRMKMLTRCRRRWRHLEVERAHD